MYENLHPEQQLQLIRLHHEELRSQARPVLPGRERRRLRRGRGSLRLRLRSRQRVRRAASAAGFTRAARFGAARPH